jgi:Flp pilus assembly pilin Flp
MNHAFARLHVRLGALIREEHGQDLIEYALIGTILVLLMIATFPPFASVVNSAFSSVSSLLA